MSRVLVTGAHGLIGSWLVKALLARGDTVTVLERRERPLSALCVEGTRAAVEVVGGDVRDPAAVDRALRARETELVFHLAGQTILGEARRVPRETFASNALGTWTVLDACRLAGRPRVVIASSDKVYGPSPVAVVTERSPLEPGDPYAASKAAADVIAGSYWHAYGLPVAVARVVNVYGGGDMNASRLVPEAVWAALGDRRPMIRSDGTGRRDFLYVEDAVAAYLAIADLLGERERGAGLAFNASSGVRSAVLEIVREVFAAAERPFHPDIRGDGPGDAGGSVDHSRLTELTGWRPRVDLADGVRRTVAWYRRHAPSPPTDTNRATA